MSSSSHKQILVPLINSSCEQAVLKHTIRTYPEADITVLAVITPLDEPFSEGGVLEIPEERRQSERNQVESLVNASLEETDEFDGTVKIETTEGMPTDATVDFVMNHHVEHVILAESHLPKFVRRVVGSPETSVMRRVSVPVTVCNC